MQLLPRELKRAYAVQRQHTKALVEHFSALLCLPQLRRDAYIVVHRQPGFDASGR